MFGEEFQQVKPNLFRFTIREEPRWDDPRNGYELEVIVAFLEQKAEGGVWLWYSHHEHYSRKKKNLRWKLDQTRAKATYRLSRDLKDMLVQRACYAWWHHCFTGEIDYLSDRKDPEAEKAQEIASKMAESGGTVQ